jgi:hypothetical protein
MKGLRKMYHFPLKIERNGPQDLKIDILNYSRGNSVKQPFWWCAGLSSGPKCALPRGHTGSAGLPVSALLTNLESALSDKL